MGKLAVVLLALHGSVAKPTISRLRLRQETEDGPGPSQTLTISNPCDDGSFAVPKWDVSWEDGGSALTVRDSANNYNAHCPVDLDGVSVCDFVVSNTTSPVTESKRQESGTKLQGHGFWADQSGTTDDGSVSYIFTEEWLCNTLDGSYPSLYKAEGTFSRDTTLIGVVYEVPDAIDEVPDRLSDLGPSGTKKMPEPDEALLRCVEASWTKPGWIVSDFSYIPVSDPLDAADPDYFGMTVTNMATGSVRACVLDVTATRDYVGLGYAAADGAEDLLLFSCGAGTSGVSADNSNDDVFAGNFSMTTHEISLKQTWKCGHTRFVVVAKPGSRIDGLPQTSQNPTKDLDDSSDDSESDKGELVRSTSKDKQMILANILSPVFSLPLIFPDKGDLYYGSTIEGCHSRSTEVAPRWQIHQLAYNEIWYRENSTDGGVTSLEDQSLRVELKTLPNSFMVQCRAAIVGNGDDKAPRVPSWYPSDGTSSDEEVNLMPEQQPVVSPDTWLDCVTLTSEDDSGGDTSVAGFNITTKVRFDIGKGFFEVDQSWVCGVSGDKPETTYSAHGEYTIQPEFCGQTTTTNRATMCKADPTLGQLGVHERPCSPQWDSIWCNATAGLVFLPKSKADSVAKFVRGKDWWFPTFDGSLTSPTSEAAVVVANVDDEPEDEPEAAPEAAPEAVVEEGSNDEEDTDEDTADGSTAASSNVPVQSPMSSNCVYGSLAGPVVWKLFDLKLGLGWGVADGDDLPYKLELSLTSSIDGLDTPTLMATGPGANGQSHEQSTPKGTGLESWGMEFDREQHSLSISQTWSCGNSLEDGGNGDKPLHFRGLWLGRVDELACKVADLHDTDSLSWGISCNTSDVVNIVPYVELLGHGSDDMATI